MIHEISEMKSHSYAYSLTNKQLQITWRIALPFLAYILSFTSQFAQS